MLYQVVEIKLCDTMWSFLSSFFLLSFFFLRHIFCVEWKFKEAKRSELCNYKNRIAFSKRKSVVMTADSEYFKHNPTDGKMIIS